MSEPLDYLSAGERLKTLLEPLKSQGLREVFIATDIENAKQLSQIAPAVHVMYRGDRIDENTQSGRVTKAVQTWLVIFVNRAPLNVASNQINSVSTGVFLSLIIQAIVGKTHDDSTFKRVNSPVSPAYANGFSYIPLAFEITVKIKGDRP